MRFRFFDKEITLKSGFKLHRSGRSLLSGLATRVIALALLLPFTGAAETLVVGLGDQDYPPFYFSETPEDGGPAVLQGISIDVCNALAETLGYELEYRRFPLCVCCTTWKKAVSTWPAPCSTPTTGRRVHSTSAFHARWKRFT